MWPLVEGALGGAGTGESLLEKLEEGPTGDLRGPVTVFSFSNIIMS